ncbi:glycosyltransferase family 4 protein [Thiocapsa bogorovii]|uniref:glycosyltransferase family 4 protein n=1 Tax=Thiocapsa bogorovii TaxID=521689 RepID=UPI001E383CC3|nr:glycosyltransferase family 1 protein [Thiocapsa bogorovii]UHD14507.1 glycosyltransferase family 4 protein [Thiocapsa bogorovii]
MAPLVWGGIGFFSPRRPLTDARHPLVRILEFRHQFLRAVNILVAFFACLLGRCITAVRWVLAHAEKLPIPLGIHSSTRVLLRRLSYLRDSLGRALSGLWYRLHGNLRRKDNPDFFYRAFGLLTLPIGVLLATRVRFRPGDVVVLVDSTWDSSAMLSALFSAQQRSGLHLGVMIHDLFPLTIPEVCQQQTIDGYVAWFRTIAERADFFITNSEATRQTLDCYLREHPPLRGHPWRSASFRLGSDLGRSRLQRATTPSRVVQALPGFVVLAVGTIEPRKNYPLLLDAMDRVWDKGSFSLLIVGKPGWENLGFMERLAEHPLQGSRLLHLENADDDELLDAFRRADCLVCPSRAEGFGLPIVEGLVHGLPILASDIAVFREIGGNACKYFPLDDPGALAEQIIAVAQEFPNQIDNRVDINDLCPSWSESARQFRDVALGLAAETTDLIRPRATSRLP